MSSTPTPTTCDQKEIDGAWYKWVQMERHKRDKSKIAANKKGENEKRHPKKEKYQMNFLRARSAPVALLLSCGKCKNVSFPNSN